MTPVTIMALSPQERNYLIGKLAADALFCKFVHRGAAESLRLARDMARLSVGAKLSLWLVKVVIMNILTI